MKNPLEFSEIKDKINKTLEFFKGANGIDLGAFEVPQLKRDIGVLPAKEHPPKKGLSYLEGKKRLLHDLASIELQAMELGLRTLIEFSNHPEVPEDFLQDLSQITKEEAEHCSLCLDLLEKYGGEWGDFPVHTGLWDVAHKDDHILERLLKVHRFLEGSGLDAGFTLANRFQSVPDGEDIKKLLYKISQDELHHVQFGSKWFAHFCEQEGLSRISECKRILRKFKGQLPYRREPINEELRLQAGFLKEEVQVFREHQKESYKQI